MKKLGFVIPWHGKNIPGGAEMALRDVTSHLHKAGIELEILATCVEKFTADWNVDFYEPGVTVEDGITVRRFRVRQRDVQAFDAVNAKLIAGQSLTDEEEKIFINEMVNSPDMYEYIREHKDEYGVFVFIPYMFGTTYFGALECLEKAVLIPCFHDEAYAYMNIFREAFSKVAGMLFNAKPEAELTEKLYDISDMETEVMGLGMDVDFTGDGARFRKKFGINEPFILYAGRKDSGKNIHTLISYFKHYKRFHGKDLKLVLIGGGEVEIPIGIQNEVIDLGFVDIQDKYDAYAAASLLCQPSKNESFSYVIMESWLMGRPVLVHSDCAVTKNFAIESNGGLYFMDYPEFEGAVSYILEHEDVAQLMGQNGRKYVIDNFAWDAMIKKYVAFFERVIKKEESKNAGN